MDIPHFIQHPPTETELETFRLLLKGKKVQEIADLRCLDKTTIDGHTKSLRFKFHTANIHGVISRMVAVGYASRRQLIKELPENWLKYLRK